MKRQPSLAVLPFHRGPRLTGAHLQLAHLKVCLGKPQTIVITLHQLPLATMLRTQDIPGKGVGVIATRQIFVGTLVLSERPIIQVASSTYQANLAHLVLAQLQKLDSHDREGFLALRNTHKQMLPIEGIFKTNAIPLGRGSSAGGIFLQCSRFNHSCTANAAYHWDANQKRERVFAIREINPEEEIVVSYLSEDVWALPTKERKARILQEFGFQCRCARCENNDPNEQLQSDQRRTRFGEIYRTIGDGMLIMLNPSKALKLCREALKLLQEEGESSPRFETIYYDAFQVCICHGDVARAKVFASLAVDAKRVWNGTDSCELPQQEELARRPESHRLAFQTKKWSSAGSSSSSSSKIAAFPYSDEWLWRRAG